jgi:cysteine-rich repeat protein
MATRLRLDLFTVLLALALVLASGCGGKSLLSDTVPDAGRPPGECGNGVVEGTEACDLGEDNGPNTGCELDCTLSCTADADCDDENLCNGSERCNASNRCEPVGDEPPDGTKCGEGRLCHEGECVATCDDVSDCDEGSFCSGFPSCVGNLCLSVPEPDGVPCVLPGGASGVCIARVCTPQVCGDGICTFSESAAACPVDCPAVCGDMLCTHAETRTSCYADCGSCGDGFCTTVGGETAATCPLDCPAVCGDMLCTHAETRTSCYADCGSCGDGFCTAAGGETVVTCPVDCPAVCGDGQCTHAETRTSCYADCGSCGDGTCDGPETPANCAFDCAAVCGNGVLEGAEQCDDGNLTSYDGCSAACRIETAFRIQQIELVDPHTFIVQSITVSLFLAGTSGCQDFTNDTAQIGLPLGFPSIPVPSMNSILSQALVPQPVTGQIPLSVIIVSDRFAQTGTSIPATALTADCETTTSGCTNPSELTTTTYDNGTCFTPLPNTMNPTWAAALNQPSMSCFQSASTSLTLDFSGIEIPLRDAVLAGEWSGNPATEITKGVIRGFVTSTDAHDTNLLEALGIDLVMGALRFSTLLPGGTSSTLSAFGFSVTIPACRPANTGSPSYERDTHAMHGQGWWFYLNYTAARVTDWYTP